MFDTIETAVQAARARLPRLSADYATQAVASGQSLEVVKADLCDRMLGIHKAGAAELSRASMVKQIAAKYGDEAAARAASSLNFHRAAGVDPKALPAFRAARIEPEPPVSTISGRAMARASMEAHLRAKGIEPLTRG